MLSRLRRALSGAEGWAITKNIGWLFFDKALRMVGGLLVGVWVARYLGPVKFGTLNYAVALASLFTALATLGLDELIIRNVVRDPSARGEILGTALALRLGSGLITIVLIQITAWIARPDEMIARAVVTFVSLATVGQAVDVLKPWFESQVRSKYRVIAENVAFIFAALVRVALILSGASLVMFAAAMAMEVILAKAMLWFFYSHTGEQIRHLTLRLARAKTLLTEGWPLVLSGLSVMIYMRIDQIMLASMVGDEAVGIYSAAVRISEIWYFVPVTIVASIAPSLTATQHTDPEKYERRFQLLFSLLTALSYAVIIPMTLGAPLFMSWIYGDSYADAGVVLSIHIWAGLFVASGVVSGRWLLNEGLTKLSMIRTVVGAIINLILNFLIIPTHGAIGAAVATVVSYAVSAFLIHGACRRTLPVFKQQVQSLVLWGIR